MIDCSQSVFKLETACGLLSGKGSETLVIRFAPTNPINYYRRLTCLVQNQVTLSTEFSLMFFDWTYWWFIKGTGIGGNGFKLWTLDMRKLGLLYVSGKLPTYPSPKSTVCSKWEVSVNVGLGEGWGGAVCQKRIMIGKLLIALCFSKDERTRAM